jgi:membrane fusion protein (multidrug efflux system)
MNPIVFAMRRPITTLLLGGALLSGGALGLSTTRVVNLPPLNTPKVRAYLDFVGTHAAQVKDYIVGQYESYFHKHEEKSQQEHRKIVLTSPKLMDVTITQPYVCQIHSRRHIKVFSLESGYLAEILVAEGQAVKQDFVMFKIVPRIYKARLDAESAEARLAQLEFNNTKKLFENKAIVSQNEVALFEAKMARARAKADLAQAEFDFTSVKAPFDGIVDRLHEQLGSLIKEGDILTTLSDNSTMWVYFNVPEKEYLEYMANRKQHEAEDVIELELANHEKFPQPGKIGAIEAKFNNETGTVPFRADFKNPDSLLRHGQTGTILIHRRLHNATVIPMRAVFENLAKRYVYVVGEDDVVHQREIIVQTELDDIFVIKKGLEVNDRIVLEGAREARDGDKKEYEFRTPEEVMANQKNHAE